MSEITHTTSVTVDREELLALVLEELRELKAARLAASKPSSPAIDLGFGALPKGRQIIYANRQYPDCLWYFWNHQKNTHEPIEQHAITGFIEKLEIEQKEFRKKTELKLNLTIRADQTYVIQAGVETLFGRGLLHTLAKLPPEAFRQPIMIAVEAGEAEQVLFCRIYNPASGKSVYAPYPEDTDWAAITQRAMTKINGEPS